MQDVDIDSKGVVYFSDASLLPYLGEVAFLHCSSYFIHSFTIHIVYWHRMLPSLLRLDRFTTFSVEFQLADSSDMIQPRNKQTLVDDIDGLISRSIAGDWFDSLRIKKVLLDGLLFGNGVALSDKEDFVLIAETARSRIHRYWLTGDKGMNREDHFPKTKRIHHPPLSLAGQRDLFVDGLPGYPDGVRYEDIMVAW